MNLWNKAQQLSQQARSFVCITLTATRGSAPQDPGAKCLVSQEGLEFGTVGGGKVEAAAIEKAWEILKREEAHPPLQLTWNLQKDIKMTCGGEVTLLFEHFPASSWKIALFGAGHIGQALAPVLTRLNCQLTIIDERHDWLDKLADNAVKKLSCAPKDAITHFDAKTFFISVTKGHASDVPVLWEIFKHFPNAPYIGVIGSKAKANVIAKDLSELGVAPEFIERIRIPVGLPIGTNAPEEIAISIAAELLQVRDTYF